VAMLVKHSKGYSFYNALNYVLGKGGAKLLDTNTTSKNAIALEQEFNQIAMIRPNVQRRLYHCSLSLPTDEHLEDSTWRKIARDYLDQMGFSGHQYVLVKHTDTPSHEHVHIVANRVGKGGTVANDSWDHYRAQTVAKDLEATYGLQATLPSWKLDRNGLSKWQLERAASTGEPAIQRQLQNAIDGLLPKCNSFPDFMDALDNRDIGLKVHYGYRDQAIGLSYTKDGITMSGSALGRGYSLEGIREQLALEVESELTLHDPVLVIRKREVMAQAIATATAQGSITLPELIEQLSEQGVEAHVIYQKRKGKQSIARAIAYSSESISFAGEALGPNYHLAALTEVLAVDYKPDRDDQWIKQWQGYRSGKLPRPDSAAELKKNQRFEIFSDGVVICNLQPNQVYVFGSSQDGQHATGVASTLFGGASRDPDEITGERAVWGQARGHQVGTSGSSYAIAIRPKWTSKKALPVGEIKQQLETFSAFAVAHPEQEFFVGRFHDRIMRQLWAETVLPENVHLPKGWRSASIDTPAAGLEPKPTSRIVITGDTAARFTKGTRDQAIGHLKAGLEKAFQQAKESGYGQLEFVSSLCSGVEHWGAVAALQLRAAQREGKLPATPVISVVAVPTDRPGADSEQEQRQRILEAVDRLETQRKEDLLRGQHDQLLCVELKGGRSSKRWREIAQSQKTKVEIYQISEILQKPLTL
jgi:hypothetical protein